MHECVHMYECMHVFVPHTHTSIMRASHPPPSSDVTSRVSPSVAPHTGKARPRWVPCNSEQGQLLLLLSKVGEAEGRWKLELVKRGKGKEDRETNQMDRKEREEEVRKRRLGR